MFAIPPTLPSSFAFPPSTGQRVGRQVGADDDQLVGHRGTVADREHDPAGLHRARIRSDREVAERDG